MQALPCKGKVNKSKIKLVWKFICIKVTLTKPFKILYNRASNSSEDRLWTVSDWKGLTTARKGREGTAKSEVAEGGMGLRLWLSSLLSLSLLPAFSSPYPGPQSLFTGYVQPFKSTLIQCFHVVISIKHWRVVLTFGYMSVTYVYCGKVY